MRQMKNTLITRMENPRSKLQIIFEISIKISTESCLLPKYRTFVVISKFLNERRIERRSKTFERRGERKVLQKLSASGSTNANFLDERERKKFFWAH